jgi:hypothetical protein
MDPTESNNEIEDPRLGEMLRQSRPAPDLPPGFENSVWRRIEAAEAKSGERTWAEALTAWLLRPRLALASAILLVLAGASLGAAQGSRAGDELAKERYLNAVSPLELRH